MVTQQRTHLNFKKVILICFMGSILTLSVQAQKATIKTNMLYWGTTTPNLQMEFALGKKTTLEIGAGINPFILKKEKDIFVDDALISRETKLKHWLVQPEIRYWPCEVFNGSFFGLHLHGAQYNVGGIDIPLGRLNNLKDQRYEGYLYGVGISYGYQWIINPRWNFELSLGGGFARIHYNKYPCTTCGTKLDEGDYNYFGITKTALSVIYFFK